MSGLDRTIRELEREVRINPSDEEVCRRLAALYARAGTCFQWRTLAEWLSRLTLPDDYDARQAIKVIGDIGPAAFEAIPILFQQYAQRNLRYRMEVIEALGKIRHGSSLAILESAMRSANWTVRRRAAYALGQICEPTALKKLEQVALEDSQWNVRLEAVAALENLGPRALPALRGIIKNQCFSTVKARATRAIKKLEAMST